MHKHALTISDTAPRTLRVRNGTPRRPTNMPAASPQRFLVSARKVTEQKSLVSHPHDAPVKFPLTFSDGSKSSIIGTGHRFKVSEPFAGGVTHYPGPSTVAFTSAQTDLNPKRSAQLRPTPKCEFAEFVLSPEMKSVRDSLRKRKHVVITDYGCGSDAPLGVLTMNCLQLTHSALIRVDIDSSVLDKEVKYFPTVAHSSNVLYTFEGDYLKSALAKSDFTIGNLRWSLQDPEPYLNGISKLLGSAKVVILFVPSRLRSEVLDLIDDYFNGFPPFLVE